MIACVGNSQQLCEYMEPSNVSTYDAKCDMSRQEARGGTLHFLFPTLGLGKTTGAFKTALFVSLALSGRPSLALSRSESTDNLHPVGNGVSSVER